MHRNLKNIISTAFVQFRPEGRENIVTKEGAIAADNLRSSVHGASVSQNGSPERVPSQVRYRLPVDVGQVRPCPMVLPLELFSCSWEVPPAEMGPGRKGPRTSVVWWVCEWLVMRQLVAFEMT